MRTIKISEEVWEEIAKQGQFGETEDDVLRRVFSIASPAQVHPTIDKDRFSLQQLTRMDLQKSKPAELVMRNEVFSVNSWADLCIEFVKWLIDQQLLTKSKLPIYNCAGGDKYFINDKAEHANPKRDAVWRQVDGYYVDVKHASHVHVKNIIAALEQLNLNVSDIQIGLRK